MNARATPLHEQPYYRDLRLHGCTVAKIKNKQIKMKARITNLVGRAYNRLFRKKSHGTPTSSDNPEIRPLSPYRVYRYDHRDGLRLLPDQKKTPYRIWHL